MREESNYAISWKCSENKIFHYKATFKNSLFMRGRNSQLSFFEVKKEKKSLNKENTRIKRILVEFTWLQVGRVCSNIFVIVEMLNLSFSFPLKNQSQFPYAGRTLIDVFSFYLNRKSWKKESVFLVALSLEKFPYKNLKQNK